VRERARALGLSTAEKPESMEICFVPTATTSVLEKRLGADHPALAPGSW
jgi:tRNA U34 2-thiouridine synthase MnmA/TrmU